MKGSQILEAKLYPLRHYLVKNSISEKDIPYILKYITDITLLSSLMYKQKLETFQRVTVNSRIFNGENKRIENVSFLKYPPTKYVSKFGRANHPEESILYATFEPITALSEMRPEIGDLITISTWKLKTDYDLTVSPIFKNSTNDGIVHSELSLRASLLYNQQTKKYDDNTKEQLDIILQFIADCFNKEVEDNNHFDYFLSSYYAKRIFSELENGEVDAILYPSVRQSITMTNIAMKPKIFDDNYELVLVEESLVEQKLSGQHIGWLLKGSGYTKKIENDKITWE